MHFGIISPPVPGHIHPFGALGRELMARGHQVTFFHMADLADRIRREGLGFVALGESDHPAGSLPRSLDALGRLDGNAAVRFTIAAVGKTTIMMLRDGPAAIASSGVGALIVDQMEPAGGAIAEHLGLPFVTVCNALALNREPDIPPPFTPWNYNPTWWARARNRAGYAVSDFFLRPVSTVVAEYRRKWGLTRHRTPDESFSPLAQLSQQPALFDFPRKRLPAQFQYLGPLRRAASTPVPFPWDRLNGKPLIYASLGTLQNSRLPVFRCFAEACAGLNVQLVMTHGGGLTDAQSLQLPGGPVVVSYAPQLEVLSRARLTLTHAGLNTVLDSLTCGVPAIAIPITYEQPAIARRLVSFGAGATLPLPKLTAAGLRELILKVMANERMRAQAGRAAKEIEQAGGVRRAAEIVETATKGQAEPAPSRKG